MIIECPSCYSDLLEVHEGKEFSRILGRVIGDVVMQWECPDCGHMWDRQTWTKFAEKFEPPTEEKEETK